MFRKKKIKSLSLEKFLHSQPYLRKKQQNLLSHEMIKIENGDDSVESDYINHKGYYYYNGNNWKKLKTGIFKNRILD
ncbi:hypothetical protein J3D55_000259 [Chryseobacterium ginsenosidimutans]|nr:hypothetical protein [Chryseobacterium ginsenosidimutans]